MDLKKHLPKGIKTAIVAGAAMASTSCSSINAATPPQTGTLDDIIAVTAAEGLEILSSEAGTKEEKERFYKFALKDKETLQKAFNHDAPYWDKVLESDKVKEMENTWDNTTLEQRKEYAKEIFNDFCTEHPEYEKNGFDTKLNLPDDEQNHAITTLGSYSTTNKNITLRNENFKGRFIDFIAATGHEFGHAGEDLNCLPDYEGSLQQKLKDENAKHYAKSGLQKGSNAYEKQPLEGYTQNLQDSIKNRSLDTMPEEFTGGDIFVEDNRSDITKKTIEALQSNPEILAAFKNDDRLYKQEIEKFLPSENDLKGKLFLPGDKEATKILNDKSNDKGLEGKDFSGSKFIGVHSQGQNFKNAKFDDAEINNTALLYCDLSGVDLSKIKEFNSSSIEECEITDTKENKSWIQKQKEKKDCIVTNNKWIKNDKSPIAQQEKAIKKVADKATPKTQTEAAKKLTDQLKSMPKAETEPTASIAETPQVKEPVKNHVRQTPITKQENEIVKKRIEKAIPKTQTDAAKKLTNQLKSMPKAKVQEINAPKAKKTDSKHVKKNAIPKSSDHSV
jgi:hypothetical protein